jgi:O-antigen/teichoic acid export membrane protein
MEFNNIIDVGTTALQQLGVIVILAFGGKLLPVVYWLAASFGLGMLCYVLCAQRFFPWWALVPGFSTAVVRRNLRYSSNMMSISFLAMVQMQADKVMMSKLLPIGLLGYYGFAYNAVSKATLLTNAVAQAVFPFFSSLFATRRRDWMMPEYRKLQDLLCFGSVPLFAIIPFAAIPVFGFVFNPHIAKMLLLPVTFLALGSYMNGTLSVPYVFSLAVGKPDISARSNFYALFVVLPATGILIYFFGLAGAGFSWVFYHLFTYSYAVPRICSECLEIPVSAWYRHVLKIAVLTSLTYGLAWLTLEFLDAHSILHIALTYAGASTIFLVGFFFLMGSELRETVDDFLQVVRIRIARLISQWKELSPVVLKKKSRGSADASLHPPVHTELEPGWDE